MLLIWHLVHCEGNKTTLGLCRPSRFSFPRRFSPFPSFSQPSPSQTLHLAGGQDWLNRSQSENRGLVASLTVLQVQFIKFQRLFFSPVADKHCPPSWRWFLVWLLHHNTKKLPFSWQDQICKSRCWNRFNQHPCQSRKVSCKNRTDARKQK